jgi:hypothetical protein
MIFENGLYDRGRLAAYENLDPSLPRTVVFRDSSSSWVLPFVSESFSRIVALGSPHNHEGLIEREKPDVVILELIERWVTPHITSPVFLHQLSFQDTFQNVSGRSFRQVWSGFRLGRYSSAQERSERDLGCRWMAAFRGEDSIGWNLPGRIAAGQCRPWP